MTFGKSKAQDGPENQFQSLELRLFRCRPWHAPRAPSRSSVQPEENRRSTPVQKAVVTFAKSVVCQFWGTTIYDEFMCWRASWARNLQGCHLQYDENSDWPSTGCPHILTTFNSFTTFGIMRIPTDSKNQTKPAHHRASLTGMCVSPATGGPGQPPPILGSQQTEVGSSSHTRR